MRHLLPLLVLLTLILGCKEYSGGAVEIAWVIRGDDQHAYECDSPKLGENQIAKVRLIILTEEGEDLCESGRVSNCEFVCERTFGSSTHRGVTPFTIPEGEYYIGLVPLSIQGIPFPQSQIQTPQPMLSTITRGNLTFMGVWQLVVKLQE